MATYTFTQKTAPGYPGQLNNFGGTSNDANRQSLGSIGAGPQTSDATATPVVSPVSVSTSSPTTITIPGNASQLTIIATTSAVNFSESDNTVATHYATIPTGVAVTIDVARTAYLYLKASSATASVSFWFNVI